MVKISRGPFNCEFREAGRNFVVRAAPHPPSPMAAMDVRIYVERVPLREPEFEYDLPVIDFVRVLHRKPCAPRA